MTKVDLTPVYVLHTRPFRNTSLIVEFFSHRFGRIAVVAKSARGPKSRFRGHLQLFTPMLVSWQGLHELKTLTHIELSGMPLQLHQQALFCGFYFNELLMRLLQKEDPHSRLFDAYQHGLQDLEKSKPLSEVLRHFEKKLLEELGYGLPLKHDAKTGLIIQSDAHYYFEQQQGFIQCDKNSAEHVVFEGSDLLGIAEDRFHEEPIQRAAKRLMRMALSHLLGNKPLNSREFF